MKKFSLVFVSLLLCFAYGNAATYLISSKATNNGSSVTHNGIKFTVGETAFADFSTFQSSNIVETLQYM